MGSLRLLVDSTGIKMVGEGEWKTRKHGTSYRRQWRKVHLGVDAETLDIRAIEVTMNSIGDAPTCAACCNKSPRTRGSSALAVTAPTTSETVSRHAGPGADPVIPVRCNGKTWTKDGPGADARNERLRAMKRLGRTVWKKWSSYHKRKAG